MTRLLFLVLGVFISPCSVMKHTEYQSDETDVIIDLPDAQKSIFS